MIPDRVEAWGVQSFPASDPPPGWAGLANAGIASSATELVMFTVGHSTHRADEFVALLKSAGIETLADVRRYPGSRRLPHFNAEALADSLAGAGIGYLALSAELGGRRAPQSGSTNDGWRVRQFQGYADHMASDEFAAGLAVLERQARERRVAVMCAEGDWRRCHRRMVADAAMVRGWQVRHLLRDGSTETHQLTEFAIVDGTAITYPAAQPQLGAP